MENTYINDQLLKKISEQNVKVSQINTVLKLVKEEQYPSLLVIEKQLVD